MNFFRFSRLSQGILSKVKALNFSEKIKLPEKWKGGRIERLGLFWRDMLLDYKAVSIDVMEDCKTKPYKAMTISAGLFLMLAAIRTNPGYEDFHDQVVEGVSDLIVLSESTRNPISEDHMKLLTSCENQGVLRRLNLLFFSIMWVDDYDSECKLYSAQCSYLRPEIIYFHRRIIDVGMFRYWWCLRWKMIDFDINPDEWSLDRRK